MLLRADPQDNTISMLSFPRDLNVEVRCPNGRIVDRARSTPRTPSAARQGTLETVRPLTGLQIHYLITVNFEGFRQIVDKLGGVWLDVDRRYLNDNKQRRRHVRDDQPAARLPAAQGLAGARLRPLQAHRLRPLPARAPAAVREGDQAGREHEVTKPEQRARRSSRRCARTSRSARPAEGRSRARRCSVRALRLRPAVRELRPGQDRRADRDERADHRPVEHPGRRRRSSRTRTSTRPRRRPSRSASARGRCERWAPRARSRPRSSS